MDYKHSLGQGDLYTLGNRRSKSKNNKIVIIPLYLVIEDAKVKNNKVGNFILKVFLLKIRIILIFKF